MPARDETPLRFWAEFAPPYVASGKGGVSRHLGTFLEALPAILSKVRAALKPGGLHLATFKAVGAEGRAVTDATTAT